MARSAREGGYEMPAAKLEEAFLHRVFTQEDGLKGLVWVFKGGLLLMAPIYTDGWQITEAKWSRMVSRSKHQSAQVTGRHMWEDAPWWIDSRSWHCCISCTSS